MDLATELLKLGPAGLICVILLLGYMRENKRASELTAYLREINEKRVTEARETLKVVSDSAVQINKLEMTVRERLK